MSDSSNQVLIRDRDDRFIVSWLENGLLLGAPCSSLSEALKLALESAPGATIWRENVDHRGRGLGPPLRIHPAIHGRVDDD